MRKRSRYRPRPVLLDTMAHVRSGLEHMCSDVARFSLLKIKNHDALDTLVHGTATRLQMELLTNVSNLTGALAKQGFGADWTPEIRAGEDALLTLSQRGTAHQMHFVGTGPELNAVRELMGIHDAQLEAVTIQDVERAMDYVIEVKRNKLARHI